MMGFNEKLQKSESIEINRKYPETTQLRSCSICNTTKTPLWRGGPSGPKSLCNACGIKYRKRRRDVVGLKKGEEKLKKERRKNGNKLGVSFKLRLMALGDVLLHRSVVQKQRKIAEEEEAAMLLMALSCGFVYA